MRRRVGSCRVRFAGALLDMTAKCHLPPKKFGVRIAGPEWEDALNLERRPTCAGSIEQTLEISHGRDWPVTDSRDNDLSPLVCISLFSAVRDAGRPVE